jgi:ABC-type sugar transport system substrate-binding protein
LGNQSLYVFAFNDELASQAWQVARNAGVENQIKFIGVDGLNTKDGGIQMVLDGKLNATLLYPTGGAEAIESAVKIYNKQSVPKRIKLSTTIIDRLNAEIMRNQFDKIIEQQGVIENQVNAVKKADRTVFFPKRIIPLVGGFIDTDVLPRLLMRFILFMPLK